MLVLHEHSEAVRCVDYCPTRPVLATGSQDRTVKLWDPAAERVRAAVAGLDWILLGAVAAITAFSLFVIANATENDIPGDPRYFLDRQILFVAIGTVLMVVAIAINIVLGYTVANVLKLIDALEENEDVQTVTANYDMPEAVLQAALSE